MLEINTISVVLEKTSDVLFGAVTYETSDIRFGILQAFLYFSAYKVLSKNIDIPCYEDKENNLSANDGLYFERLYEIQNGIKTFFGQLWFCALTMHDAFYWNHVYERKKDTQASSSVCK